MEHEAQLAWEARASRPVAAAAFMAVLMPLAAALLTRVAVRQPVGDVVGFLSALAARPGLFIAAYVLQAVGIALAAPALVFLFRAARHRGRETPRPTGVLAIAAPLVFAVVFLASQLALLLAAREFVGSGARTAARADDLLRGGVSPALLAARLAVSTALGLAFILVARNAMRAGLLSRFMGILGIALGLFYIVPLPDPPRVLHSFWLGALGLLALDRWPGGRGPAWRTGEPTSWPSAAEQRSRRAAEAEERSSPDPGDPAP